MIKTIKEHTKLYALWLCAIVCIALSIVTTPIISAFVFVALIVATFFLREGDLLVLLFGLFPFANIFKMNAGSTSLFTIYEIFLITFLLLKQKKISVSFIVSIILLFTYIVAFSLEDFNIFTIIKVIYGFLLLSVAFSFLKKEDVKNIAYLLSASTIIMLLLCNSTQYFSYVVNYFPEEDLDFYVDGSGKVGEAVRSGGFLGDPNYCAMLIIATLSLLCLLYYYKNIGTEFWLFALFLIPLGFFTYSKSYFLCVTMFVFILIVFVLLPKHKNWAIAAIVGCLVVISMAFSGRIEVFNMILARFDVSNGDITTGRDLLNEKFLAYIVNTPKVLFFGEGIFVEEFKGVTNNVHNFYIELLFKLGIVGSILYIVTLCSVWKAGKKNLKKRKRKLIDYVPLAFVLVMYYFLAGVLNYALPFYIIIAYVGVNYSRLGTAEDTKAQELRREWNVRESYLYRVSGMR